MAAKREEKKQIAFEKLGVSIIRIKEMRDDVDLFQSDNTIRYKLNSDYSSLNRVINSLLDLLNLYLPNEKSVDVQRDQNNILEKYAVSVKAHSIANRCPSLVNEWIIEKNRISPDLVSVGSHKKVLVEM